MNSKLQQRARHYSIVVDDRGAAVTSEVVFVTILSVIGLIVAFSSVRDSVISEFSDIGGSVQDFNQSFVISGAGGSSSTTGGMGFVDELDHCDDAEDSSGTADNQISFDVGPTDEFFVSTDNLDVFLGFDGNSDDSSPNGNSNDGTLQNGATIVDGQLVLDGVDDFLTISNSGDINTGGPFPERSVHIEFTPNDVTSRQVIFEEGGQTRGLSIYIDNGLLYIGGWNLNESGWQPTFVSTPITAGVPVSASLTLNGGATVAPNAISGYFNGSLIGRDEGSQLWSHGGGIGIGGANGFTRFHDGAGTGGTFNGSIDSYSLYNRTLSDSEISGL